MVRAPQGVGAPAPTLSQSLIAQINQYRAGSGAGALAQSGTLTAAAQAYADLLFARNPYALDHFADGGPQDRAARYGYYGSVGEMLAVGQGPEIMNTWLSSAAHFSIMMDGQYTVIGIGCHEGPYAYQGQTFTIAVCVADLGT